MNAPAQSFDNLPLSVRMTPDGTQAYYVVTLYGREFVVGHFPGSGFVADLTEAAEAAGQPLVLPPATEALQ